MSHHTNIKIMNRLIIAGFFLEAAFGIIGAALPQNSFFQIFFWELGAMSLIASSTLMAVKLARQNWDIPAAGYTSLAIAQGVFYSVLSNENTIEGNMDSFALGSGVILLLPSMLLIFYYKVYPLWLRILGVVICVPFLILMYQVYDGEHVNLTSILNAVSFSLLQITSLCWGVVILRSMRSDEANKN